MPPKEAVRPVVKRGQGPVAEAEKSHIKLALIALSALSFQVHFAEAE